MSAVEYGKILKMRLGYVVCALRIGRMRRSRPGGCGRDRICSFSSFECVSFPLAIRKATLRETGHTACALHRTCLWQLRYLLSLSFIKSRLFHSAAAAPSDVDAKNEIASCRLRVSWACPPTQEDLLCTLESAGIRLDKKSNCRTTRQVSDLAQDYPSTNPPYTRACHRRRKLAPSTTCTPDPTARHFFISKC